MHQIIAASALLMLVTCGTASAADVSPLPMAYDLTGLERVAPLPDAKLADVQLATIRGGSFGSAAGGLTYGMVRTIAQTQFEQAEASTLQISWIATDVWFANNGSNLIFANIRAAQ